MRRSRRMPTWMPAARNGAILLALAFAATFLGEGLALTSEAVNSLLGIAMVTALVVFGVRYFQDNRLKWLVIKQPLRIVVIVCAVAIAVLLIAGPLLFADLMSPGARYALALALGLVIAWVVVQSRRY